MYSSMSSTNKPKYKQQNKTSDSQQIPIYYQNIRSVPAKENLHRNLKSTFYKVICLTETWLTESHKTERYIPSRFNTFRHDRSQLNSNFTRAGGLAILVDSKLKSIRLKQYENDNIEGMCVKVWFDKQPIVIYLAYVPELDRNREIVFELHAACIERILSEVSNDLIIMGDFNMRVIKWQSMDESNHLIPYNIPTNVNLGFNAFLSKLQDLSLNQYSHIANNAGHILDLVFSRNDVLIYHAPVTLTNINKTDSAHPPIELAITVKSNVFGCVDEMIEIFVYSKANYDKMRSELSSINFAHEFNTRNVEKSFEFFYDKLNSVILNNIPKIKIKSNKNKPKWWNSDLQKLKNKKNKEWKRRTINSNNENYEKVVKEFNDLNEICYSRYLNEIESNIKSDPTAFWKFARERTNNSNYPSIMCYEDSVADSPESVVNLFAKNFETYFRSDDSNFDLNDILNSCSNDSVDITVSIADIDQTIDNIKTNGAIGADDISPKIICNCKDALVFPLWILFQKTFTCGSIPSNLKMSRIIPIHKKGDKSDVKNYRMVAVGTTILQIFEKTVNRKLTSIVNCKLSTYQHGFRAGRSVTTNLLSLSIAAHNAFSNGKQLDVFYGDFEKAFDRVSHPILLKKLTEFGIGSNTIKWIANFLNGRGNFVKIDKHKSFVFTAASGVGAGTSLGPLLFLIFINDITKRIKCTRILLLADDLKIFVEVASEHDALKLKIDIARLAAWCKENKLDLNVEKCFVISLYRTNYYEAAYEIDGRPIKRVNEIRDLGVLVDNRLDFISHIGNIISSARQTLGYIKWLSNGRFHKETLMILYNAYVRSKLEFAAAIWDPYRNNYKSDLESIQKQFLLYLLGDEIRRPPYRIAPYKERCKLVNMQTLNSRRILAKLMLGYDIIKCNDDPLVTENINYCNSTRNLRSNRFLIEAFHDTDYSYWQPIASIIRLLNEYCDCFSNARSKNEFKKLICKKLYDFVEPEDL